MAENSCCDLQMERFQLINNLFSAKFCRTFEITSYDKLHQFQRFSNLECRITAL